MALAGYILNKSPFAPGQSERAPSSAPREHKATDNQHTFLNFGLHCLDWLALWGIIVLGRKCVGIVKGHVVSVDLIVYVMIAKGSSALGVGAKCRLESCCECCI